MLFAMPLHVLPGYLVFYHFIYFFFFCKQMAKYVSSFWIQIKVKRSKMIKLWLVTSTQTLNEFLDMWTLAAAILPSRLMNSGRRSLKYYGGTAHHSEVGSWGGGGDKALLLFDAWKASSGNVYYWSLIVVYLVFAFHSVLTSSCN